MNEKENFKNSIEEIKESTEKLMDIVNSGEKIRKADLIKLSETLKNLIFTLQTSDKIELNEIFQSLDQLLYLAAHEEFFKSPLEAKVYLYPYLALFYEEIENELKKLIDNPEPLLNQNHSAAFRHLALTFLELELVNIFKNLINQAKSINNNLSLEVNLDIAGDILSLLRDRTPTNYQTLNSLISGLKIVMEEIAYYILNFKPSEEILEKMGVIIVKTILTIEDILNNNTTNKENLLTIVKSLYPLIVKLYPNLKRISKNIDSYFQSGNTSTLPVFAVAIAKLLKLLETLECKDQNLISNLLTILKDFNIPREKLQNTHITSPVNESFQLPSAGIIFNTPSKEKLTEIAEDSVFPIYITGKSGNNPITVSGTCFIYKQVKTPHGYKLYFLTNLHNIQAIHSILNRLSEYYQKGDDINIGIFVRIDNQNFKVSEVYVPVKEIYDQVLLGNIVFRKFDFAVFTLYSKRPHKFFGIRRTPQIRQGETVYAFGYPSGLALSMSEGIISHVYNNIENEKEEHHVFLGTIQHSILINPGNSGGPTVKENGEVVGISTFGLTSGVGLNFSIDISFVINCLQDRNLFRLFKIQNYIEEGIRKIKAEKALF